ncbi:MAG: DNA polymerase III subunit beta [Deltaproteobacteria bacterium]|nr:DNA polymerase III subunit beta [Deltaproteobacteria bacterium]
MDLYINRDELSRGLARVQSIIERRSTQPVLSHVLLEATADGVQMTATDTEVAYIGHLAAKVEVSGSVAVDAAQLFQVVRSLPEPTLRLQLLPSNQLEIISGRAWFRVPGLPAEDYPTLPPFASRSSIRVVDAELRRLVDQVHFAVATDDTRYGLNGAYLEAREGAEGWSLRMVATDGHRLCAADAKVEGEPVITPQMLVPRKALQVMRKLLSGSGDQVVLDFGEGAIRIVHEDQTFWFRMLDGVFPDYHVVVPKAGGYLVRVRKDEFSSTLKRVSILVQDRVRPVRFAFEDGELEIGIDSRDKGEVRERIAVDYSGTPMKVGFNVRYLQEVVSVLSEEYLQFELSTPLAPCMLRAAGDQGGDDRAFFVVMPMRLD